ncbi:hypothetical protein B9S53_11675 [Arthrospira sp. O9.13F]|nr:hypothetical protein B9S53_11675 [Arthrospira sp. O9.13F]
MVAPPWIYGWLRLPCGVMFALALTLTLRESKCSESVLSKSHVLNPLEMFNDSVLGPGTSTHSRVGTLTLALNVAS